MAKQKFVVGKVLNRLPPYIQPSGYLPAPPEIDLGRYREMATSDATVAACLEFVTTSALSRLGEYHHEKLDIQEFIRTNFELLSGSFYDVCRELLSCLWAGFSVAEIVTQVRGGQVWLHSLPVLPCESLKFHLNEDTESINYGEPDYIIQRPYQVNEAILPLNKCVYIRNQYSGGLVQSPYGMSRLQVIQSIFDAKEQAQKDWADSLARFATPFIDYAMENPNETVERNGQKMPAWEAAKAEMSDFQSKSHAFIHGTENKIAFTMPPHNVSDDYERLIDNYNRQIMRGLLIPSLLFDSGDHGSYALGQEHMELYQEGITALLDMLTEALLEQLIRPLITINFGLQDSWGYFDIKRSSIELSAFAALYLQLAQLGIYNPANINDVNDLRRKFGFSEL